MYTVNVQYVDGAGNVAAKVPHSDITYAGTFTLTPTLQTPHSYQRIPIAFLLEFWIPEAPEPGSIVIKIFRTEGPADPGGTRVITLADSEAFAYQHNVTLANLSHAADLPYVADVTAGGGFAYGDDGMNLVNEVTYTVGISYKDATGHDAATHDQPFIVHDNVHPFTVTAVVDYDQPATLDLTMSEPCRLTKPGPGYRTVLEFFELANRTEAVRVARENWGQAGHTPWVDLFGATIVEVDGTHLNITLTEQQRVHAIALSGTPGGDGGAAVLNVGIGG